MSLFDVVQIVEELDFALCITLHDTGYYFAANASLRVPLIGSILFYKVRRFSIDFVEKVVCVQLIESEG